MIKVKKITKYFQQHVYYNSGVHMLAGIGIGILITYPLVGSHPLRWGITLLLISLVAHFYPLWKK